MPSTVIEGRQFDARPDRIDLRDRIYSPSLVCLPEQYPDPDLVKKYLKAYTNTHKLILNQGKEGACTGFGLAAVINYLLFKKQCDEERRTGQKLPRLTTVSPRMLYQMARVYDEWPGEDYEGSSCRGAMKGWHRHGVCAETLWPYKTKFVPPVEGWQQEAARRPLGAYYRINKDSIADLQAAVTEVGAVYVSAAVHKGWFLGTAKELPVINVVPGETGGHAFAIVGYTTRGFIIQNSWGAGWGYLGFAILPYEDWIQRGSDAWVAVLGAPMEVQSTARTWSSMNLQEVDNGMATWYWRADSTTKSYTYVNSAVEPLSESAAYEHTVVLGNDGRPLNRFLDVADAAAAVQEVAYTLPRTWLAGKTRPKIALYAHGGLNNEDASIKRIRIMAPYFRANDIYPLFITWKTGFGESLSGMLDDALGKFFKPGEEKPARGWMDDLKHKLKDAKDRSVELACEQVLVKPLWMQMKQNAGAAADRDAGLTLLAAHLAALRDEFPSLEIHLVGHSAGSILHGYLLGRLMLRKLPVSTVSLFAPACTVGFALDHYVPAVERAVVKKESLFLDILSDERERSDTVGPYGKSLLYLVSRALEDVHKMPLLGMEAVWNPAVEKHDLWNRWRQQDVATWRAFMGGMQTVRVHTKERARVFDGQDYLPLAHGSFDNDIEVIAATLERIRGGKLKAKVESLHGF